MKLIDNLTSDNQDSGLATPGLIAKIAMAVSWVALLILIAVSLTAPARAEEAPAGHLPSNITLTRGTKDGKKSLTFNVNAPHSVFRFYDKIGTSQDRSDGNCYKNRVWFEYYKADVFDDNEPIRQSHQYTFRQREEGAKVCLLVVFDDFRQGAASGYHYGPFSFDQNPPTNNKPDQVQNIKPKPQPAKKSVSGTIHYDQDLELPSGSRMRIELRDTSSHNTNGQVVVQKIVTSINQPHQFKLSYSSSDIEANKTYGIEVRVVDSENNLLLTSGTPVNVAAGNNPSNVRINLVSTQYLTNLNNEEQTEDIEPENNRPEDDPGNEQPPAEFKKPLPLQTKKPLRGPKAPNPSPEPETTNPIEPKPVAEDSDSQPEPIAEQTPADPVIEQDIQPPAVAETPTPTPTDTDPEPTKTPIEQSEEANSRGFMWLGIYVATVLLLGMIALLLLNRRDSK